MNLFEFDSPFMNFLSKAVSYMLVCLLCLLFSLPVITAGAAFTASYYVGMKLIRDEGTGFLKPFINSFKENFKQSTAIWFVELLVGCFLAYDWYLIYTNGVDKYNHILLIVLAILTLYFILASIAVFALIARFSMSSKEAIKGALAYTYINIPRMIFVLILTVFPTAASIKYANWLMAIWPVGSAACLYIISYNFSKSFKKLELHVQGLDEEIVKEEMTQEDTVQEDKAQEEMQEETNEPSGD